MEIKKDWTWCNNYPQIEYSILKPMEEVELVEVKNEYKRYDWEDDFITKIKQEEKDKYIGEILKQIPNDEKILDKSSYIAKGIRSVVFHVYTKPTALMEKEKEIEKILTDAGFELWEHNPVCLDEGNWVKLDGIYRINYDKETINKIAKLLNASDWEVVFDSHMEDVYLVFKLQDE